jgi:hypothetical protein
MVISLEAMDVICELASQGVARSISFLLLLMAVTDLEAD